MKVRELMEALKQFPGDMLVLTDGYESGFEEIRSPRIIEVKHESGKPYYDGEYQLIEGKKDSPIKAVAICRNRRTE